MTRARSATPSSTRRRCYTRVATKTIREVMSPLDRLIALKLKEDRAARLKRGARVAPGAGGRGYLPRPWTGMASSQCRPCEPRPVEGDVGDRELPHGGARRACRALRGVLAHAHRLQLLPQPALPEVPGRGGEGMAGRARGRAAAGAVLPRRVHAAGADRRHRLPEQGRDLRSPVQGLGRDADHDRGRSQAPRRPHRHHCPSCTPGARRSPTIRTCT